MKIIFTESAKMRSIHAAQWSQTSVREQNGTPTLKYDQGIDLL